MIYDRADDERLFRLRLLPKDLGVALVALAALALAWLVMQQATGRTRAFVAPDSPLRLSYPAGWSSVDSLQDVLLKVEDAQPDLQLHHRRPRLPADPRRRRGEHPGRRRQPVPRRRPAAEKIAYER